MAAIESRVKSTVAWTPKSACELILAATGLAPEGSDICDERHLGQDCSVCGAPLVLGQPVDALDLPNTFTNHSALAHPGGKWRCGACTVVMSRVDFQRSASSVLITQDGIYPMMQKAHRAWALQTPPETAFALCIQNAKQQHIVWRTPLTINAQQTLVRIGDQVIRIRREVLRQAAAQAGLLASLKSEKGRPIKNGIESPFEGDLKLQSGRGGMLKPFVYKLLEQGVVKPEDIDALLKAGAGEAWALDAYMYEEPVEPESIAHKII